MSGIRRVSALLAVLTICIAVVISGCKAEPEIVEKEVTREVPVTREVEVQVEVTKQVEVTRIVEQEVIVEVPAEPVAEIPFAALWVESGHAKTDAEAFIHWDEDDPAEIPPACAKCHSTPGYQDFLGIDGTHSEWWMAPPRSAL